MDKNGEDCEMIRLSRICLFSLFMLTVSCRHPRPKLEPDEVIDILIGIRTGKQSVTPIASYSCNDRITSMHVASLLDSHGIFNVYEGSIVYGVSVLEKDEKEALVSF